MDIALSKKQTIVFEKQFFINRYLNDYKTGFVKFELKEVVDYILCKDLSDSTFKTVMKGFFNSKLHFQYTRYNVLAFITNFRSTGGI